MEWSNQVITPELNKLAEQYAERCERWWEHIPGLSTITCANIYVNSLFQQIICPDSGLLREQYRLMPIEQRKEYLASYSFYFGGIFFLEYYDTFAKKAVDEAPRPYDVRALVDYILRLEEKPWDAPWKLTERQGFKAFRDIYRYFGQRNKKARVP